MHRDRLFDAYKKHLFHRFDNDYIQPISFNDSIRTFTVLPEERESIRRFLDTIGALHFNGACMVVWPYKVFEFSVHQQILLRLSDNLQAAASSSL